MMLRKPNVHVFVEDGRNLLFLRDKQYYLITIEITSFWFCGGNERSIAVSSYNSCLQRRLRRGGVLQQWMQLHHTRPREIASALITVHSEFRYVSLWLAGEQGIIVASNEPQALQTAGMRGAVNAIGNAGVPPDLIWVSLLRGRLLSPEDVDRLSRRATDAVINTDRKPLDRILRPRFNMQPGLQASIARHSPIREGVADARHEREAIAMMEQMCTAADH